MRLCAKKKRIGLPAILRGRLQRRQAAKPVRRGGKSYRADHNFFAALRLCAKKNPPRRTRNSAGQALRLGEKKKKELRAKTPSRKGLRKVDRQDGIMQALK